MSIDHLRALIALSLSLSALLPATSFSYPNASKSYEMDGVQFFQDHKDTSRYWYMPRSIEAVKNPNGTYSKPSIEGDAFLFSYRGRPSVNPETIQRFAAYEHVPLQNISAVNFETTGNTKCYGLEGRRVSIQVPSRIGSFGETTPVTIYTEDAVATKILARAFADGSGLSCTVDTNTKFAADAYHITWSINWKDLYEKFEMAMHGEFLIFEFDLDTKLKEFARSGAIQVYEFSDENLKPGSESPVSIDDKREKVKDMFLRTFEEVKGKMFQRVTKLPDGTVIPPREKAFSLRIGYEKDTESFSMSGAYHRQSTVIRPSTLTINVNPFVNN